MEDVKRTPLEQEHVALGAKMGDFAVVPNAANVEAVHALLTEAEPEGDVVRHRPDLVTIAVQGPRATGVLEPMLPAIGELEYTSGGSTCGSTRGGSRSPEASITKPSGTS